VYNQGIIGGKWVGAKSGATISVFSALANFVDFLFLSLIAP
jgi:hypothetical protein